jgi:hypothetical protein
MPTERDAQLWKAFRDAEAAMMSSRSALVQDASELDALLDDALGGVSDRGTALRLLELLPETRSRPHLARLVEQASVGHAEIGAVRSAILRIDRAWTVENIDRYVIDVLNGEEEYRRFAELYAQLDESLLAKHLGRCAAHDNAEVREIADDYADPSSRRS